MHEAQNGSILAILEELQFSELGKDACCLRWKALKENQFLLQMAWTV